MDAFIFTLESTCGYSNLTTTAHLKVSRKPSFDHWIKWGEFLNLLEDRWHFYFLLPKNFCTQDDRIYFELYNDNRHSREKYFKDMKTFLEYFEGFLTKLNSTCDFQIRYFDGTKDATELSNAGEIFTDEKGTAYLSAKEFPAILYRKSYVLQLLKIHEVIERNQSSFLPGSFIREKLLAEKDIFESIKDPDVLDQIFSDKVFIRKLLDDPEALLIDWHLYVKDNKR